MISPFGPVAGVHGRSGLSGAMMMAEVAQPASGTASIINATTPTGRRIAPLLSGALVGGLLEPPQARIDYIKQWQRVPPCWGFIPRRRRPGFLTGIPASQCLQPSRDRRRCLTVLLRVQQQRTLQAADFLYGVAAGSEPVSTWTHALRLIPGELDVGLERRELRPRFRCQGATRPRICR